MSGEPQGPLLTLGGDLGSPRGMEVKGHGMGAGSPPPFLEILSRTSGSDSLERADVTSFSQLVPDTPTYTHTHTP